MTLKSIELIDPNWVKYFDQAPTDALCSLALAAAELVVDVCGLKEDIIADALRTARAGAPIDPNVLVELEGLVTVLDRRQWDMQDAVAQDSLKEATYLLAFRRTRAANAVCCALRPEPIEAATEAIYEAYAAMGNNKAVLDSIILEYLAGYSNRTP